MFTTSLADSKRLGLLDSYLQGEHCFNFFRSDESLNCSLQIGVNLHLSTISLTLLRPRTAWLAGIVPGAKLMGAKQTVLRCCQISATIFQRIFNLAPCPVCMVEAGKAMELFGCGTNHELPVKPKDSRKSYMFNARIGGDWAKDIC